MLPQQPNSALDEFKKQLAEWETKNVEPYDKAILTLSSGALALSLAFIKDLVTPQLACFNWLLYTAWFSFVAALTVNVCGFIYALRSFRMQRKMAPSVYGQAPTKTTGELAALFDRHMTGVFWFNVFQGICFLAGMFALTLYVVLNLHHGTG